MTYRVGIIGAGALGLLYAGMLRADVTLYTHSEHQAVVINENNGIAVRLTGTEKVAAVRGVRIEKADFSEMDLVIVTVKSYQLDSLEKQWGEISLETPLLFLQNGIGHLELLANLPQETILVGSCEHGVGKIDDRVAEWRGMGRTNWALYRGRANEALYGIFDANPDFLFLEQVDYREMLYNKLLVNAVINPLTAVLGVSNGALLHNEYMLELLKRLTEEVATVLAREEAFQKVSGICEATALNFSSMATDVKAKRRTEIESITGAVVKLAKRQGKPAPISETLYGLVKGLEGEYLQ